MDCARGLSAKNAKYVPMTKRRKGKYIPQNFIIRASLTAGDSILIETLPNAWPVKNSVVMAGGVRDAMLRRSGIKRKALNTYDKELQIRFDATQSTANTYLPSGADDGVSTSEHGGTDTLPWGLDQSWVTTQLVSTDGDGDAQTTLKMVMQGTEEIGSGNNKISLIRNWRLNRKSYDPHSDASEDQADNLFARIMNPSGDADDVIAIIDDEGSEKPYDLVDFETKTNKFLLYTGAQGVMDFVAPLGLLKITTTASSAHGLRLQVLGIADM